MPKSKNVIEPVSGTFDEVVDAMLDSPKSKLEVASLPNHSDLIRQLTTPMGWGVTSVFRRCHNYIHANGGLQKAEAFHEMLKLIFCKTYDEQEGGLELDFSVSPNEQKSIGGQRKLVEDRLKPLFEHVKRTYPWCREPSKLGDLRLVKYIDP